ncbi:MAG TPA: hypothetical protein EYP34_07635 [Chromatiaceae bacterium]|nr:hypothetical protein [Chromatiaceae bacterium]
MGILKQELERMARLATHRHFALALVIGSGLIGLISHSGFLVMCFVGIFLEIVGWLFSLWLSFSLAFMATNRQGKALKDAAVAGIKGMMEANFPRQFFGYIGGWLSTLAGLYSWRGEIPSDSIPMYLSLTVMFGIGLLILNVFLGAILGTIAGIFGKSQTGKSVMK